MSGADPLKDIPWAMCLGLAVSSAGCAPAAGVPPPAPPSTAPRPVAVASPPADLFAAAVRPVLASRCTPCHEPGGRMYDRMPFDSPGVVASHRTGVLRRIKDPVERKALEDWLATLPPG